MSDNGGAGAGAGAGGGSGDVSGYTKFLQPPAVTALRQEARQTPSPSPPPLASPSATSMERSLSQDIRDECEDLKEAAEQTLNVVVDLDMDGRVKWVSPSWREVIGSEPEEAEGKLIRDIVLEEKDKPVFEKAVESLKRDDSRSFIVRFSVKLGPASVFRGERSERGEELPSDTAVFESSDDEREVLQLEGQGIMVYETGGGNHVSFDILSAFGISHADRMVLSRRCGCSVRRLNLAKLQLASRLCC